MSTVTLARFIIVKSTLYYDKGHVYCKEGGSVVLGEESVFSTLVKIEAERAASNNKYVNQRFCNNNKYWQKGAADNKFIVAESTKPEEDTTKPSCTLFEATKVNDNKVFYLTHVQSGGRLVIDGPTLAFYVELNPRDDEGRLFYDDWETLVNLPKRVTFKGFNGSYLQGIWADGNAYLQFAADDPNAETTGYHITLLPNGLIRIYSNHFTSYWRAANNWIWASSTDASDSDNNILFWPVKIDNTTIALRSLGNNNFCQSHNDQGKTRCLNAAVTTITNNGVSCYNFTFVVDKTQPLPLSVSSDLTTPNPLLI